MCLEADMQGCGNYSLVLLQIPPSAISFCYITELKEKDII